MENKLYPLALIRPWKEIEMGAFSFKQRWQNILGENYPEIPLAIIPTLENKEAILNNDFSDCQPWQMIEKPWHIFQNNITVLLNDIEWKLKSKMTVPLSKNNNYINEKNIHTEANVTMNFCNLNASDGPIYISKNTIIMEGCSIRGPIYIGENSVIKMNSSIYGGTSIFNNCTVGGEIKNSVLMSFSNKAHEGYMGDSVIGKYCNWGAGTYNSNVKNTANEIKMYDGQEKNMLAVGKKAGVIMGDYSFTSIGTMLNSGTIIGTCCNIFNPDFLLKNIPSFTWRNEKYEKEKIITHIKNWAALKKIEVPMDDIYAIEALFDKIALATD